MPADWLPLASNCFDDEVDSYFACLTSRDWLCVDQHPWMNCSFPCSAHCSCHSSDVVAENGVCMALAHFCGCQKIVAEAMGVEALRDESLAGQSPYSPRFADGH